MFAYDHVVFWRQLVGTILVDSALEVLCSAEVYQPLAHPAYQDLLLELQSCVIFCLQFFENFQRKWVEEMRTSAPT